MVVAAALAAALPVFSATKAVIWSLPDKWAEDVSYPIVEGYRAIEGGLELRSRAGYGKVGEPNLPYYIINVALPDNGTFGAVSADVEWEAIAADGLLPFPILEPVPSGAQPSMPPLGDAYSRTYPSAVAKSKYLEIASGVRMMPIVVTPFKWEGATKTLYKATKLTVRAEMEVPDRLRLSTSSASAAKGNADLRRMALSLTINPEDATTGAGLKLSASSAAEKLASFGDDRTADFIILSPNDFVALWEDYAIFRKNTTLGATHDFAVVNTRDIYAKYTAGGDDALKIHHYLEDIYALGKAKYVLLGAAAKKYKYDPDTMIPTRYVVAGGGLNQISDEYYGCMNRLPEKTGVEVWDYDGDGYYMGHRNADGSYTADNPAYVDFKQDIIVFRFPLMAHLVDSGFDFTAADIMANFKAKVDHLESDQYATKYDYCLSGSTVFGTGTRDGKSVTHGMNSLMYSEREFFDGNVNTFDPEHAYVSSDSELMPRDRHWEFLTRLRGNGTTYQYNSSQSNATWNDMYDRSGAVFNIWAHGWARGCSPGNGESVMKMAGYYTLFVNPIPCDSGMFDYCPNGSYGITNCISFGEAPVLSPHGGLASFNNTRLGWLAGYKTSGNWGSYSSLIEHYLFESLSGVTRWQQQKGYQPMDAGEALMYAKNSYGDNYSRIIWGLAGVQVTGQGDPLARLPVQDVRVWNGHAGTTHWNATDLNWTIPDKNGYFALDHSRDIVLPLATKGDTAFDVQDRFTAGGLYAELGEGADLTIGGNGTFKVYREAVVTNGNLVWSAAGGIAREGLTFFGARGNLTLPGNAKRYFGEKFRNVGAIRVTGGNVTIDTPINASFEKSLDYGEIAFLAERSEDVTEWNTLRSRTPGIFKTDKRLCVTHSKLNLQTYNIGGTAERSETAEGRGSGNAKYPLIYATNSTIRVQANPMWKEEYFVRPTHLNHATIAGDYDAFAFGPDAKTGYDLFVSDACALTGDKPIKLNGTLRVHFEGEGASLAIANPMMDGLGAGNVTFDGAGAVTISAAQTFTGTLTVPSNVTVRCAIADALSGNVVVESGGVLALDVIPLAGIASLTVEPGGELWLPPATAKGIYHIVDATTCDLELQPGAKIVDAATGEEIRGDITEGYLIQQENILYWRTSGGTWDFTEPNAWTNAQGEAKVYTNAVPLVFADTGANPTVVNLAADVRPGFMDFRNGNARYLFQGVGSLALDSLAVNRDVTFDVPLTVGDSVRVSAGAVAMRRVDAPIVEVSGEGELRITGEATVSPQKVRKLRFEFYDTYSAGSVAAIQEMQLMTNNAFFRLPVGTVIRDVAGQSVTVVGAKGADGHLLTGHTGDEQLGALVDGNYGSGNNKWWASKSSAPTWFEITFPEPVGPFSGYKFCTADSLGRNPKTWKAYSSIDGTHWAQTAQVTGYLWGGRRDWIANGVPFGVIDVNGFLTVKDGGTLVADGAMRVNVEFQAGTTLAVTNACCLTNAQGYAKLMLPESGKVRVDLVRAKKSKTPFPILRGFNLTAEQFGKFECVQDTAMLQLKDGDIYAATDGIMVPPYTASVGTSTAERSETAEGRAWSDVEWSDKYKTKFRWGSANLKADGTATLTVSGNVTLTDDVSGTIGKLVVNGSGSLTVVTNGLGAVLEPATLDGTAFGGALVWDVPVGSAAILAGNDTRIGGGAPGTGLLSVGAGRKATLLEGVAFANQNLDKTAVIRYGGRRTEFELENLPDAIYAFEDADLTGVFTLPEKTILSEKGDKVMLNGTNISYYARSLLNFDIRDGLVEIDAHGPMMSFGRTGVGTATKFAMSGGIFRCYAEGSGANDGGLLMGYEGGTGEGAEIGIRPTAGLFEVPNSFLNFFYPTIFHLTGDARLRAKGFISTQNPGTIVLGTNVTAIATSAVLEVGSLGFRNNAASVMLYGNNTTANTSLLGYEDGAYIEQDVNVYGHSSLVYPVTVAATNNTTFTLRNMAFVFTRGAELIVFGDKAKNWDGTIKVETLQSLPPRYKLAAGRLDLGTIGCSDSAVMTAEPASGAKIKVVLPREDYESGAAIDVLRCDNWASGKSADQIRAFLELYTLDAEGREIEVKGGTLKYLNGLINFIPEGGAGYVFPLSATVTANKEFTKLAWKDRNNRDYTNDWNKVRSAELVCNGTYTVTMDKNIAVDKLITVTKSGKMTIEETQNFKLSVAQVDDSSSAGTTILHITLGAGATVKAGKALEVNGAPDATTEHGTIQIPSGGTATIRNGLWNGAVGMVDKTSKLAYRSDKPYDTVPSSLGKATVGSIHYYQALNPSDGIVQFGSDTRSAADGMYYTYDDAYFTCKRFLTGIGNGTIQNFVLRTGITVRPESEEDEVVLANDAGSDVSMSILRLFDATNSVVWVGKGGSAHFHIHGGAVVKGLRNDPESAPNTELLLYGNTLTVGSAGIDIVSEAKEPFFCSGQIVAYEDATIRVEPYIGCSTGMALAPAEGVTMMVVSPIGKTLKYGGKFPMTVNGKGKVILEKPFSAEGDVTLTDGTLRLVKSELLGTGPVVFNGGKLEVMLKPAQAIATKRIKLFATAAAVSAIKANTTMRVIGSENEVDGAFSTEGGYAYFTPTGFSGAHVEIAEDTAADWTALPWLDKDNQSVDPAVWGETLGTVTISNAANTVLGFDGSCTISELVFRNEGNLAFTGAGTMTVMTLNDATSFGRSSVGAFLQVQSELTAGRDTAIESRGNYTVNVAQGKKVTIPGWTTPSNVKGAGVVALDMGAREAAVETYWNKNGGGTATNQILCGTWTLTDNAQYPNGKNLLVSGADAVLKLRDKNDITGYNNVSGTITVEDGGAFQVCKRDTFCRSLYLRNGGQLLFEKDVSDNSRIFDWFGGSQIFVEGAAPSIIGGFNATNDGYGSPTVNSGVLAIRRSDLTINVPKGSTLKVYSQWSTDAGSGGSFIKSGTGVMEQYRASTSALPFNILQGVLRLVNNGTVTTGGIAVNYGLLEVVTTNGCEKTMANVISGIGGVAKRGAGSLVLSAANTFTGGLTVEEGTLRLGNANAFQSASSVVVEEGTVLDLATCRPEKAVTLGGAVEATVLQTEKDSEAWFTLFHATGDAFDFAKLTVYDVNKSRVLDDIEKRFVDGAVQIRCQQYRMPIALNGTQAWSGEWTMANWRDANGTLVPSAKWASLSGRTNLTVEVAAPKNQTLTVDADITIPLMTVAKADGIFELRGAEDVAPYRLAVSNLVLNGNLKTSAGHVWDAISGEGTLVATNFVPVIRGLNDPEAWTGCVVLQDATTGTLDLGTIANANSRVELANVTTTGLTVPNGVTVLVTCGNGLPPIHGPVTFADGSVLRVTTTGFALEVVITDGALTMDPEKTTLEVDGKVRPAGSWSVEGGTIKLPLTYPLRATANGPANWNTLGWTDSSATPITVPSDFWQQATDPVDVVLTVNAVTTLTLDQAVRVNLMTVHGAGALTIPTSTFALANVAGDGKIVCTGFWPGYANLRDATKWTGTVVVKNVSGSKGNDLANLGNASSVVEMDGVSGWFSGYASCTASPWKGKVHAYTLKIGAGGFTMNDGSSNNGYCFHKMIGSGAFSFGKSFSAGGGNPTMRFVIEDVSDFTGTIAVVGNAGVTIGEPTGTIGSGKLVVNADIVLLPGQLWSAANGIEVKSGCRIDCDLGGLTGVELAKRTVANVPFVQWFTLSAVTGEVGIKGGTPTMPKDYALTMEKAPRCAIAVTAPEQAKFGVFSLNLHNGTALSGVGNHGLYPDVLANWGNLRAQANQSASVSNVAFRIGGNASGYGISTYSDAIYQQYLDDSGTTRTVTISGIAYAQYRIIVYYSTDTADYQFQPLVVNDGTGDVYYAGATQLQNEKSCTVKGRNTTWGHSGPDKGMNAMAEGVNLLVTDMMSAPNVTLKFTRVGNPRATPCAIQIVKVGEIVARPTVFWIR